MFRGDRDLDTICALSTPQGHGAIAVVRLSGPLTLEILSKIAPFIQTPQSHRAYVGFLVDIHGGSFDQAVVTFFEKGRSFTGEATAELSVHGSQQVVNELLVALCHHGARLADRGEFTYRAFMNGRLDLVQAESVLSLIQSQSRAGARQALRQLRGSLSVELERMESEIIWALAHIEAGIDFSTEGLEAVSEDELLLRLGDVLTALQRWIESYKKGKVLRDGLTVVLLGVPNVGKSSLLNVLVNEDRAIVTDIPGTTRDLIEGSTIISGLKVNLIDTAGLRETSDVVEKIGVERTHRAKRDADLVCFVFDIGKGLSSEEIGEIKRLSAQGGLLVIANKCDGAFSAKTAVDVRKALLEHGINQETPCMAFSALDGESARRQFSEYISSVFQNTSFEDQTLVFQARHFERLSLASERLAMGLDLVAQGASPELAALDLKEALLCLQEVLGKHFDDQVLDRVFKEFCIGK